MKYEIEKNKGSVKIKFTVPAEEFAADTEAAYQKSKGKFKVPGFRPGHAPKKVIEKMYGAGVFFDDAFNICASRGYGEALDANSDIYPVDEPKVDISDFGDEALSFSMEITVKPEVTLGQYTGLELEKTESNVTDADVKAEIDRLIESRSRMAEVTDRAVKSGDTVKLDYSGSVDGVKFAGGTAQDQELVIGSNSFIPGFEDQLIGFNVGEEKDISVKFPDDYHAEELKGKDAVFTVKINGIRVKELPELNDEFVKEATKFDTVAAYTEDTKARLVKAGEERADNDNKNRMVDAIVANATVDVPDCMVQSELDYMLQDFEYRLSYMYGGMKLDDYFKYTGSSREDFRRDRANDAKNAVKTRLVMEAVIKQEKTEATDEDVDAKLAEIAKQAGKTLEEYKPTVNPRQLDHIKSDIIVGKTLDNLVKANKFTAKKTSKSADKPAADKPAAEKTARSSAKKTASTAKAKKDAADKE